MAKKKTKAKVEIVQHDRDAVFADATKTVEQKLGKVGMLVGKESVTRVLPVPSLVFRYLLQNEGLPLGNCYQVVGPEASFKSTFLGELQRLVRWYGGVNLLCEAESKDQDDLRAAVNHHAEGVARVEECETLEQWQAKTTWFSKEMKRRFELKDGAGRTIPMSFGVDSLTGKPDEKTRKDILETGFATPNYPRMANLINTYMKVLPGMMTGWPFFFVGINHLKLKINSDTGQVDHNIPGGASLRFQCLMIIGMEKRGQVKQFANHHEANISFWTIKNNAGADNRRIQVKLKIWSQEHEGEILPFARFEWEAANVDFLLNGTGMKLATAKMMLPKIKQIVDFRPKSGGDKGTLYWSKTLDIPESDPVSPHEAGTALEQRPDLLLPLYELLGVRRRDFFQPGIDYRLQLEETIRKEAAAEEKREQRRAACAAQKEAVDNEIDAEIAAEDPPTEETPGDGPVE